MRQGNHAVYYLFCGLISRAGLASVEESGAIKPVLRPYVLCLASSHLVLFAGRRTSITLPVQYALVSSRVPVIDTEVTAVFKFLIGWDETSSSMAKECMS